LLQLSIHTYGTGTGPGLPQHDVTDITAASAAGDDNGDVGDEDDYVQSSLRRLDTDHHRMST